MLLRVRAPSESRMQLRLVVDARQGSGELAITVAEGRVVRALRLAGPKIFKLNARQVHRPGRMT